MASAQGTAQTDAGRRLRGPRASASDRPRIIIAFNRLEHLRLNIVRLDRINEPKLLQQLKAIKAAKTAAEVHQARLLPPSTAGGNPWPPRNAP